MGCILFLLKPQNMADSCRSRALFRRRWGLLEGALKQRTGSTECIKVPLRSANLRRRLAIPPPKRQVEHQVKTGKDGSNAAVSDALGFGRAELYNVNQNTINNHMIG